MKTIIIVAGLVLALFWLLKKFNTWRKQGDLRTNDIAALVVLSGIDITLICLVINHVL